MAEDITKFMNRLTINRLKFLPWYAHDMLPLSNCGMRIAYDKAVSLNMQINFAATALSRAYKKEQMDLFGEPSKNPLIERVMNLTYALLSYNSCLDFIWQVLYFYYNIDGIDFYSFRDYKDVEKCAQKVQGSKIKKIKECVKHLNPTLYVSLMHYERERTHITELSNAAKHRASFWVSGLDIKGYGNAEKRNRSITSIVTPPSVDIEDEIEILVLFNNETVKIEREIWDATKYRQALESWLSNPD